MLPAGFEPAIPASDRPQTLALNRSATGIGCVMHKASSFDRSIFVVMLVNENLQEISYLGCYPVD